MDAKLNLFEKLYFPYNSLVLLFSGSRLTLPPIPELSVPYNSYNVGFLNPVECVAPNSILPKI